MEILFGYKLSLFQTVSLAIIGERLSNSGNLLWILAFVAVVVIQILVNKRIGQ